MTSESQRAPDTDYLTRYVMPELEPRTVEAVISVLNRLIQILESENQASLGQCYAADARQAAREQLSLDFYDDSDITMGSADSPPF